jgi:hypothetical protein
MTGLLPWLLLVPVAASVLFFLVWRAYGIGREIQSERARESFRLQHEHLEKLFLEQASGTGLPRGLRWISCVFAPAVEFACERKTKKIVALVPLTVQFEAIEGSDMEGLPAVPLPRQGTGVLHFALGEWTTSGRVVFNLSPHETLQQFAGQYAPLRKGG